MTDSAVELTTINPTTGEIFNKYTIMTKEEVNTIVKPKMHTRNGRKILTRELILFMMLLKN